MTDSFERNIDYLRISITDRCNYRCFYCMPEHGIKLLSHGEILSYEEILKIVKIMAEIGIKHIRITGGEPTVRKGYIDFLKDLKNTPGIETVMITTNGSKIPEDMDKLLSLGLDGINISIDSLQEEKYNLLTRTEGNFEKVLKAIDLAESSPITTKINCVAMKDINDDEIKDIAALGKNRDLAVRFIEYMPIGKRDVTEPVPAKDIIRIIENAYGPLTTVTNINGNGPATYVRPEGFKGAIGIIGAVTHKFCDNCNRIRLTSNGFLKLCLQYDTGINLATLLRSGCNNEYIKLKITEVISKKPKAHVFTDYKNNEHVDNRNMFEIGG